MFVACGIVASLCQDALWDDMIIVGYFATGVVIMAIAAWHAGLQGRRRWLFPVATVLCGFLLGFVLLVCSLLGWFAAEVLMRGRSGEWTMWFSRILLTWFFGLFVLLLLRRPVRRGWNYVRVGVLCLLAAGAVTALVLLEIHTGPADLSIYPSPEDSPYHLPWKPGITRLCCQGNRAVISHRNWEEFAYDFIMPVGAEICAARGGVVTQVVDHNDGNGWEHPNNSVVILHPDGSYAEYLHIRKDGGRVRILQKVNQGDVIAEAGNVGYSTLPHLHIHVVKNKRTIPLVFADVPGDGIPRMGRRYVSGSR
jgi:Peptidase family M23